MKGIIQNINKYLKHLLINKKLNPIPKIIQVTIKIKIKRHQQILNNILLKIYKVKKVKFIQKNMRKDKLLKKRILEKKYEKITRVIFIINSITL